jgi:hypothetical protein
MLIKSAIATNGSSAIRTSASLWESSFGSSRLISGSEISNTASTSCATLLTLAKSLGLINSECTASAIISTRNTRSRSAAAAISGGTIVCDHEFSAAATSTDFGIPKNSPDRTPRVINDAIV